MMAVLRVYVDNIHQLEKVEKTLEALGKTKRYKISGWIVSRGARTVKKSDKKSSPYSGRGHFARGIKSEYLEVLGPIFAHSVRPLLVSKDLWSLKLEEVFKSQLVCPLLPF